jgi:hypothetical protein
MEGGEPVSHGACPLCCIGIYRSMSYSEERIKALLQEACPDLSDEEVNSFLVA